MLAVWNREPHELRLLLSPTARIPFVLSCFVSPSGRLKSFHGTVLLEKPTGPQLVKKFPAFYKTRRFIIAFTTARHLSLSWARSIQSIILHPTFRRFNFMLSCHLRLGRLSSLLPSSFPTKMLYAPLLSPHTCYMPWPIWVLLVWSSERYLVNSTKNKAPCYVVFSIPLLAD